MLAWGVAKDMSHVRWTYLVATLLVCASLVHLKGEWGNSDSINVFNYWCGGATLVALVVAIGEIVHAGTAGKAVRKAFARAAHQQAKVLAIEVISLIDDVSSKVQRKDYSAALRALQMARRFLARLDARYAKDLTQRPSLTPLLNDAEMIILKAIHNTTSATMSREARHTLSDYLVRIKSSVETLERRGVEE
jgi:hypothetical protein